MDANTADSLAHLSEDVHGGGFAVEDADLPVIPRWWDVRLACARIAEGDGLPELARLLSEGLSQHEIADRLDRSRQSVGRTWKAGLERVMAELGATKAAA